MKNFKKYFNNFVYIFRQEKEWVNKLIILTSPVFWIGYFIIGLLTLWYLTMILPYRWIKAQFQWSKLYNKTIPAMKQNQLRDFIKDSKSYKPKKKWAKAREIARDCLNSKRVDERRLKRRQIIILVSIVVLASIVSILLINEIISNYS